MSGTEGRHESPGRSAPVQASGGMLSPEIGEVARLPLEQPEPIVAGDLDRVCEVCGNAYARAFQVVMNGIEHTFDSFECAIQKLAPTCAHCGCRIIGHDVESDGHIYCCDSCVRMRNAQA